MQKKRKFAEPPEQICAEDVILLDVGGVQMKTTRQTLRCKEDSYLARMFSDDWLKTHKPDPSTGAYFIDASPVAFGHLLNCLRFRSLPMLSPAPSEVPQIEWESMLEYYQLNPPAPPPRPPLPMERCNSLIESIAECFLKSILARFDFKNYASVYSTDIRPGDIQILNFAEMMTQHGFTGTTESPRCTTKLDLVEWMRSKDAGKIARLMSVFAKKQVGPCSISIKNNAFVGAICVELKHVVMSMNKDDDRE